MLDCIAVKKSLRISRLMIDPRRQDSINLASFYGLMPPQTQLSLSQIYLYLHAYDASPLPLVAYPASVVFL